MQVLSTAVIVALETIKDRDGLDHISTVTDADGLLRKISTFD